MRWESLFEDIEAQLAAAEAADARVRAAELVRAELATVRLVDRWRASLGRRVRVQVAGGDAVEGELVDCASDWLLLGDGPRSILVTRAATVAVAGLSPHVAPQDGRIARDLGLAHALRALARDRVVVRVEASGHTFVGRPERVGADHVELALTDGSARVGGAVTLPFGSLAVVRST